MFDEPILSPIFLIFTGAAVLATIALFARQSLLVAYILLGVLIGPWGLALVTDMAVIEEAARVGIMFLLFLLGLDLQPQELLRGLGKTARVTVVSSALFATIGFGAAWGFGFTATESLVVGAALMFSSTIIGVKLLPTTVLHHRHMGELIISVLLLQDLLAILVLLVLQAYGGGGASVVDVVLLALYLPGLILFAFLFERQVLIRLIRRFDKIQEYIFLVAIGWCLGIAHLAAALGLSTEIGAFIAGVALAQSPIALFIVQNLRPLRDFFLVMFFFALGAGFDLSVLGEIAIPGLVLAALTLGLKPVVFRALLSRAGEDVALATEFGVRLGQISEFSLLIAVLAYHSGLIGSRANYLIQIATLLSFTASSYWVVLRYPTPIAVSDRLRRD